MITIDIIERFTNTTLVINNGSIKNITGIYMGVSNLDIKYILLFINKKRLVFLKLISLINYNF